MDVGVLIQLYNPSGYHPGPNLELFGGTDQITNGGCFINFTEFLICFVVVEWDFIGLYGSLQYQPIASNSISAVETIVFTSHVVAS